MSQMSSRLFVCFLFFSCVLRAFAQQAEAQQAEAQQAEVQQAAALQTASEKKASFSYGFDFNLNSGNGYAFGAILGFDIKLSQRVSAGLTVTAGANGDINNTVEPSVLIRFYFLEGKGFFAQLDGGVSIISESGDISFNFLAGIRGGYRFHFGSFLFTEAFLRVGYPYLFGTGMLFGYRL